MLNILVCDDDKDIVNQVNTLPTDFGQKTGLDFFIDLKNSAKDVLKSSVNYDIAFIDIEMPEINGLTLAEMSNQTNEDMIAIVIDKVNEQFIIFKISNSCDFAPQKDGKHYKTSKTDNEIHGIGIKSINRIAKKYNGYSKFAYNENEKTFYSSVILKG